MSGESETWIARDYDGALWVHEVNPTFDKVDHIWHSNGMAAVNSRKFPSLPANSKARLILDSSSIVTHDGTPVAPAVEVKPEAVNADEGLLDTFAGQAMTALAVDFTNPDVLARESYIIARAMLAEKQRLKAEATNVRKI